MEKILRRPLAVIATFAIMVFAGGVAWFSLPVELLPSLKYPRLVIITSFGNASAEEVESLLTHQVEEAVGAMSGLKSMSSTSTDGISKVVLSFHWGTNMALAAAEVREKLDLFADQFPREATLPVVIRYDPTDAPVVTYALTGAAGVLGLRELAQQVIKKDLETVKGVAAIRVSGGTDPEIQILADPARLAAHKVDLRILAERIESANINFPGGTILKGSLEYPIRTVGKFKNIDEISTLSLGRGDHGGAVLVKDVAVVEESSADRRALSRVDGEPAVLLNIIKEQAENTLDVVNRVVSRMNDISRRLPKDTRLTIVDSEAPLVAGALQELKIDIVWGAFLAFLTLLVVVRKTMVASLIMLSIPVSVLSTVALMRLAGVSLNLMSVGGMALGVGMLLDCSIVVLESMYRRQVEVDASQVSGGVLNRDPIESVSGVIRDVSPSLISGTLTTLAVLLPILFLTGAAQRLFRDFAFTLGASLLISLFTAVALLPAIAIKMRLLVSFPTKGSEPSVWLKGYQRCLAWVLEHPARAVMISALIFGFSVAAVYRVGFELLPNLTTGRFTMIITLPSDSTIERVEAAAIQAESWLREIPEVEGFVTEAGLERGGKDGQHLTLGTGKSNQARISIRLKPGLPTFSNPESLIQRLRAESKALEGAEVDFIVRQGPLARVLGSQESPELLRLAGDDLGVLSDLAQKIERSLGRSAILRDVYTEGRNFIASIRVVADRYKVAAAALTVRDIADGVRAAIEGKIAGKFIQGDQEKDIRVRLASKERTSIDDVRELPLLNRRDELVFLGRVADVTYDSSPREITRHDRQRSLSVHGNVVGKAFSDGQDEALRLAHEIDCPKGCSIQAGAERLELRSSLATMLWALGLAVMLVYAVMVVQFESLLWPLVVFSAVPATIFGPALALSVSHSSVSVVTLMGLVVLVGIVVNQAILIVATYNNLRRRPGASLETVLTQGALIRFRPIVMTKLTAIFGALPVCIAGGTADPLYKPLAVTLVTGLIASAPFTVLLVPAVYKMVCRGARSNSPS
jgi:HAE1 family hydrophobic/amphiphilic exporter-1